MKATLNALLALSLLSLSTASFADCSVALFFTQKGSNYSEVAPKLKAALKAELTKLNKNNTIFIADTAYDAGTLGGDYMFMMSPTFGGFKVTVTNIIVNKTLYTNTFSNSSFRSLNEVIKYVASDFASDALPEMNYCQK